jgi:hypothetical protein
MTNPQNIVDLYISESTLDEILASMRDPLPIGRDGRPQIIERLRDLYLTVNIEHRLAPTNTRTALDKALKPLLRQTLDLQRRIGDDEIHWMNKILSIAALDLYVQSKNSQVSSRNYTPPPNILQSAENALSDFSRLLNHLCTMIDQFDELNPGRYAEWIGSAGTEKEMYIRNEVTPHFRKRGGVGPDTIAVRHIAEIYEFAFGRPFSPNPIEVYERGHDDDTSKLARYSGRAVEFACAVVKTLKIGGVLVPYTEQNLSAMKQDIDQSELDISALNKELAFGRENASKVRLINRIGDLWRNDSKRRRKAVPQ